MAKKKKPLRKPVSPVGDREQQLNLEGNLIINSQDNSRVELCEEDAGTGVDAVGTEGLGVCPCDEDIGLDDSEHHKVLIEDLDPDDSNSNRLSWADKVEMNDFQASAQKQWQEFQAGNLSFSEQKLEFTEPIFREGRKFAQIDAKEVKMQSANWSSTVICMVLGANPPMAVFEGFIKRVWGHLGIAQIARMTMGLTMVKFNDDATRDHVLEHGLIHFDRKPVIVRPWTTDLSAVRLVRTIPLWIRLQDLGLQYWGSKCLSALVSTIGRPIMVDKFTRDRSRVQFARVLVEMEITDNPPKSIQFINELGQIMEQGVEYEWLPIKCKTCAGFGHSMAECRKEMKAHWVKKVTKAQTEIEQESGVQQEGQLKEDGDQANTGKSKEMVDLEGYSRSDKEAKDDSEVTGSVSNPWRTPKRVAAQSKEGQRLDNHAQKTGRNPKALNKFGVLQEIVVSHKDGSLNPSSSYG
ncbi:uncharacterized protein LOC133825003 [Humulus lupulus]|uniref:uncharacterized protein LOC133825003 n=1 Tax=Humulus lupulus TaxID=3486 RepID=UPI002B40FACD|nr:uncharacterized protein LOC133825003 [Humulus lupulus]